MKQNQDCKAEPINYLIITRPLFATSNQLLDFVRWKEHLGFTVGLLTVEWIDATYPGPRMAAKIKAAALDAYAGARVAYLLLVGDTEEDMPADQVGWYEATEMEDLNKPWNVPTGALLENAYMTFTDSYYADADVWPLDSAGKPHVTFPCHLDFDLAVGRFPVRAPEELGNIVAKSQTFTPASAVLRVNAVVDPTYTESPDPCRAWPPPVGDLAAEGACYCAPPYSIQRALAGQGVTFTNHLLHLTDATEATLAQQLVLTSTAITEVDCHGGHRDNFVLPAAALGGFTTIYPLYVVGSCLVNTFYWLQSDAMTETMLKGAKGPVAAVAPKNWYSFYRALSEGKPVGEAVFSKQNIFHAGLGEMDLLGDPSLVLCVRTPAPVPWRPHRRWYWFRPFLNVWERLVSRGPRGVGDRRK